MPCRFIKEANAALSKSNYPKEQSYNVRHFKSAFVEGIRENAALYRYKIATKKKNIPIAGLPTADTAEMMKAR